jgi:peroxiredoxin
MTMHLIILSVLRNKQREMKPIIALLIAVLLPLGSQAQTAETAFQIGAEAPDFQITTMEGQVMNREDILANGTLVLIFYRGDWCPYCNKYLSEVAENLETLNGLGAQVIAVSPETRPHQRAMAESTEASFAFAPDKGYQLMNTFGVAYELDAAMTDKLSEKKGIDWQEAHGTSTPSLPVPATFVIGTDGLFKFIHYDTDYRKRPDVEELVLAVTP